MRFRPGSQCAAYVSNDLTKPNEKQWIVTRIEKILPDNCFYVRDEVANGNELSLFTVTKDEITQYPDLNSPYNEGENILALWLNNETRTWSTVFYDAIVKEPPRDGKIMIQFSSGSSDQSPIIETELSKVAHKPDTSNLESISASYSGTLFPQSPNSNDPQLNDQLENEEQGLMFVYRLYQKKSEPPTPPAKIDNDFFKKLAGPYEEPKRVKSTYGTPLLNILEDPDLFPKESPHFFPNGVVSVEVTPPEVKPAFSSNEIRSCGRLSHIFQSFQ